jgi:hypothetical protein
MLKLILIIAVMLLIAVLLIALGVSWYVQREAPFEARIPSQDETPRALILYHPSRDARFSDDLSEAVARGFETTGLHVDIMTTTSQSPDQPRDYVLIAVVANCFFGRPDRPTLRYLAHADLTGMQTIGIISGSGATDSAQAILHQALAKAGASVIEVRPFWIKRPNDPARSDQNNRKVAGMMARAFAAKAARDILAAQAPEPPAQTAPAKSRKTEKAGSQVRKPVAQSSKPRRQTAA